LGQVAAAMGKFADAVSRQKQALELVPPAEMNRQRNYLALHHAAWASESNSASATEHWAESRRLREVVLAQDGSAPRQAGQQRTNADYALFYGALAALWEGESTNDAACFDLVHALSLRLRDREPTAPFLVPAIALIESGAARALNHPEKARRLLEESLHYFRSEVEQGRSHQLRGLLIACYLEQGQQTLIDRGDLATVTEFAQRELRELPKGAAQFVEGAQRLLSTPSRQSLAALSRNLLR
jgi:hypothetical protein